MGEVASQDYGAFPPDVAVTIQGAEFRREPQGWNGLGRIEVWDYRLNDMEPVGHMPSDFTTKEGAIGWLLGYRQGAKAGERKGRASLQHELLNLLGVRR